MQRLRQWTRSRWFGASCGALALGLLFWARLIVVSDMPRTAIADEETPPFVIDDERTGELSDNADTPSTLEESDADPTKGAHDMNREEASRNSSSIGNATDREKSAGQVTENRK